MYRRLALNHFRSDGTIIGLDVIHAPISHPPEQRNIAHSLIVGNASERAMELCDRMAQEMSKHIEIYPVGSTWREDPEGGRPSGAGE